MLLDTSSLPTHLATVAARLDVTGSRASSDTFLCASYVFESALKTNLIVLYAALKPHAPEKAYRVAHDVLSSDSLGIWQSRIEEMSNYPLAGFLPPEVSELNSWLSKTRNGPDDEWANELHDSALGILTDIHAESARLVRHSEYSVNDSIKALVRIRNKTRGHGAPGEAFFDRINDDYINAVDCLLATCPAFRWKWLFLNPRPNGEIRGVRLKGGLPTAMSEEETEAYQGYEEGVYFQPPQSPQAYLCEPLLVTDRDCKSFWLTNGQLRKSSVAGERKAEFLDYGNDQRSDRIVPGFDHRPREFTKSDTAAKDEFVLESDVITNLPDFPRDYIERKEHEDRLRSRLLDHNHPLVVLHGPGGVGKTYLALRVAHEISGKDFEFVVWLSARDLDLRPSGAFYVKSDVSNLSKVLKLLESGLERKLTESQFSKILRDPTEITSDPNKGILFVFDNFETMKDLDSVYHFLDQFTHLPNKVLITTRELSRTTPGTPVEVRGMEFSEAEQMLQRVGRECDIPGLLDKKMIKRIYDHTRGHAYVMRLIVGEMAKERQQIPLKNLIANKIEEIADAVFRRQYKKLTPCGSWVFRVIANAGATVSEIALRLVLGKRDIDVDLGIKECEQLALIETDRLRDDYECYTCPELAKIFGKKRLKSDPTPDALLIEHDINSIRKFDFVSNDRRTTQGDLIERFILTCLGEAENASARDDKTQLRQIDETLHRLAEIWPPAWLNLAEFRQRYQAKKNEILDAYQNAVEENADDKRVWKARADYAGKIGNSHLQIISLIRAAQCAPTDVSLVCDAATKVKNFVNSKVKNASPEQRLVYSQQISPILKELAESSQLKKAKQLGTLAWLMQFEGNREAAREYAKRGLKLAPQETLCNRILNGDRSKTKKGPGKKKGRNRGERQPTSRHKS